MLGQIKRYAEGGDVAQSQSAGLTSALGSGLTQDQYYANIRDYAAKNTNQLEALNTMSQYGISMADVNAALGATAVKEYFTVDPNAGEKAPGSVQTDFTSGLQQGVANNPNLDQAGLDSRIKATVAQYSGNPDKLRELFVQNQTSIADLQRAGVDPSVLYSTRAVNTLVPAPDMTIGKPGTPPPPVAPPVYKPLPEPPPIYKPGEPALDVDFRNSPPRTYDDTYGYMYTPAAKLLSATGSGMSFTPPSVTSRPRSLLNIPLATTANPQYSASQQFVRDAPQRAAAQLAAMPATGSRFTGTAPASQNGELRFFTPSALTGPGPGFDEYGNPVQEKAEGGAVKKTGGTADSSARTLLDNLNNMLDNLNSEAPAKRNLPKEAQDARRARIGQAPAVAQDYSGRDLTGELLDVASLATAPVPVLGDIAGLAADARMYQMRPEERTMGNYALSALGVLPFVPSVSAIKRVGKGVKSKNKYAATIGGEPLPGAPGEANIPGVGRVRIGGNEQAEEVAQRYAQTSGIPNEPLTQYPELDVERASRIANEYELMKNEPRSREVLKAYDALNQETMAQYEEMLRAGVEPYFITGANPYKDSPYLALKELSDTNKLGVFPTVSGFGSDVKFDPKSNPLLAKTPYKISGQPALANDIFRAVHDYMGHAKPGVGFRGAGEEAAYQSHAGMYSPQARRALASETRGQNSWVNYGPYGEKNRFANADDTTYADQKSGLLPNWAVEEGRASAGARRERFQRALLEGRTGLEGAITPNGKLALTHYSNQMLDRVDPAFYGRGLSGGTTTEMNRASEKDFVKPWFAGIETSVDPYIKERGLGGSKNIILVDPELMYPVSLDPEKFWTQGKINKSERRIYNAGYTGYYYNHPDLGNVAVMFDPHPTKKAKGGDVSKDTSKGIQTQTYLINEIPSAEPTSVTSSPMSYEELVAQMDRIAATPNAKTPSPTPDKTQTESQTMLERFTSLDTPQDMSLGETAADIGMGFLPFVGTAQGARDFERARRDSDKLGMVLSAASMIPIAGGAVKAARSVGKAAKAADALAALDKAPIDTPEFKNFFGESKVVDAKGKPLMVFHATGSTNIEQFLPDGGRDEGARTLKAFLDAKAKNEKFGYMNFRSGSFFSPDAKYAENYIGENNGVMYPVYIKAENPVYIDSVTGKKSIGKNATPDAMFIMDGDKILEIAVIDPTQVKSAIGNEGTFDPTNPVMTKAKGGLIQKYQTGGDVAPSTAALIAQMDKIGLAPNAKTPSPTPDKTQTESASMLELLSRAIPTDPNQQAAWDKYRTQTQLDKQDLLDRLDAATPLERYTYEQLGMEPGLDRATAFPWAGSKETGDLQPAFPGLLYDAIKYGSASGATMRGVPVSKDEAVAAAMNMIGMNAPVGIATAAAAGPGEVVLGSFGSAIKEFPQLKKLAEYLTDEEKALFDNPQWRKQSDNTLNIYKELPPVREMATVAKAGGAKKGWYKDSYDAIKNIFENSEYPDDPERFTALLAALSPQTSVESNLKNALATWKNWLAAGRPQDPDKILKVMGDSVEGNKGVESVLGAWKNNSFRALTVPDAKQMLGTTGLSGPKVQSFFRNLAGDFDEVTNDAWMAKLSSISQSLFGGQNRASFADNFGNVGIKGPGYLAQNAKQRQAAELLGWNPAELQETGWSFGKTLSDLAGQPNYVIKSMENAGIVVPEIYRGLPVQTAEATLRGGYLTDEAIGGTPAFGDLMQVPEYRDLLTGAGYALPERSTAVKQYTSPYDRINTPPSDLVRTQEGRDLIMASRRIDKMQRRSDAYRAIDMAKQLMTKALTNSDRRSAAQRLNQASKMLQRSASELPMVDVDPAYRGFLGN
jgi:hypothetical protein